MLATAFLPLVVSLLAITTTATGANVAISPDTPINELISAAKAARARGATNEALNYFDAAIARDGGASDYLTLFQRGATYLAAGRNGPAKADFDSVLRIKPDFEGALLQRAKVSARLGDWASARDDYKKAASAAASSSTTKSKTAELLASLDEAEGAAFLAAEAEKKGDWEGCVNNAGVAIMTATAATSLRQLRAHCRFELGEVEMGVSDLQSVLTLNPSSAVLSYLQIAAMQYYILGDTEAGLTTVKRCLQTDPESTPCKALFREMKTLGKSLDKVSSLMESTGGKSTSAIKLLVDSSSSSSSAEPSPTAGVLSQIKSNIAKHTPEYILLPGTGSGSGSGSEGRAAKASKLYHKFLTYTCQAYQLSSSSAASSRTTVYCRELLALDPNSMYGLIFEGQSHFDQGNYEAAINSYRRALDHTDSSSASERERERDRINARIHSAQLELKRSKTKDYYKVLQVPRSATDREIKSAYRRLTKLHHPDKVAVNSDGGTSSKEDAERKMASINEAYEVLSDPELRQRYDQGDDPNDPMPGGGGPGGAGPRHGHYGNPFEGGMPFGAGGGGPQFVFHQGGGPGGPAGAGGGGGRGGQRSFKFPTGGMPFAGFPGFG